MHASVHQLRLCLYPQILYNLLGNSLKFTHQGHVTVTVRSADSMGSRVIVRNRDHLR